MRGGSSPGDGVARPDTEFSGAARRNFQHSGNRLVRPNQVERIGRGIVPSRRMKMISSGITVFFIQKLATRSSGNGKIMPLSDGISVRNIRPLACWALVSATSTTKSCTASEV